MDKTIGIVIKCKDYSETSQLVWLYTKDFGKIKLVAKGSRGRSKKLSGKIDLFNVIDVIFYRSHRGDLHTLGECSVIEPYSAIRLDLERLACASYVAELLDASTAVEDPNSEIFSLLLDILKGLADGKDPKFLQCIFEIKLMHYSGHWQGLDNRKDISNGVKAIIKRVEDEKAVDKLKISDAQLDELGRLLRIIIDYSVGKRLKSLSFLEAVCYDGKK